uniref:DNA damage-inducible transcript 4-like protein n=1 Tax=Graphocephala atropunctata TaxID=36148 RepID=A0A1B6MH25_9HEMI
MEVLTYPVITDFTNKNFGRGLVTEEVEDTDACHDLALRIEEELRAAKSAELSCGEVLLPGDLLPRIACNVLRMAADEPCGIRGCTLYINFESERESRKIGTVKCDPNTISTFELFLTLRRESRSTWSNLIPQFLMNLTRSTIMISSRFSLDKKKLYRSYLSE